MYDVSMGLHGSLCMSVELCYVACIVMVCVIMYFAVCQGKMCMCATAIVCVGTMLCIGGLRT